MDILQLNSLDLAARVEKEFMENPALEVIEPTAPTPAPEEPSEGRDPEVQELFDLLDSYERRFGGEERPRPVSRRGSSVRRTG